MILPARVHHLHQCENLFSHWCRLTLYILEIWFPNNIHTIAERLQRHHRAVNPSLSYFKILCNQQRGFLFFCPITLASHISKSTKTAIFLPISASFDRKSGVFREFLADTGKLYSSPKAGEVPQAERYIFQHLFNLRPNVTSLPLTVIKIPNSSQISVSFNILQTFIKILFDIL